MSGKLEMVSANKESLCDSKFSSGVRALAKFGIIHLLFITALMWLASSTALAQGGGSRELKGATITEKQLTLKRGYVASRISANTVKVRKKNGGGTTFTSTCLCRTTGQPGGGGSCNVRVDGNQLICYDGSCSDCYWGRIIIKSR